MGILKAATLSYIMLLIYSCNRVNASVVVGVSIISYTNVNGTCYQENSSERKCCDGPQRAHCENGDTCDTYFNICVGRMEANWGCNGAFIQTEPRNDTNVIYNGSRITGVSEFWDAGMGVFVFIRDSDSVGVFEAHDHIDTLIQILKFDPDQDIEHSTVHQYEWNGNNVEMRIAIQAWCMDGYHGADCKKYCQDIPPISQCGSSTGDLICQSEGDLLLEFQSVLNSSQSLALRLGVNRFMDEQVCQQNTSNVQYLQIQSNTRTATFEGYCSGHRILPIEFEALLLFKPDVLLKRYFQPSILRGPAVSPQGYGEHIVPNLYVAIEILKIDNAAATSYNGDYRFNKRKCCDVPSSQKCEKQTDTCDLQLSFCIGDVPNGVCVGAMAISSVFDNSTSLQACGSTLLDLTTGKTYVSHPLIGGMRLTKNSSDLQVIVKDIDLNGTTFDTVDILNTTITISPGPNLTAAPEMVTTLKNYVTLKLKLLFWCAPGHAGPHCTALNGTDHCKQGWSGDDCNIPSDSCHPSPCQNKGTCSITQSGTYNCTCDSGFTGPNCTQDIDECSLYQICQNNGTCINSVGAFECDCTDGWSGLICSDKIPYCNPTPCVNGRCSPMYTPTPGYICTCTLGWTGKNCDNKHVCTTSNCVNGKCIIVDNVEICRCIEGYSGEMCTKDIDECLAKPCQNNGVCFNTLGAFNCTCPTGFTGQLCEMLPSNCVQNECHNRGTCIQNGTTTYCSCSEGYTGALCEQLVDKCQSVQCKHGEQCLEKFDDFQCNCSQYWSGKICDTDINECSLSLCEHASKCFNLPGSYYCECMSGWNGTKCDVDLNECLGSPCHNGTCINSLGSYSCQCRPGFTGKHCETVTNFCSNNTCNGHGSCSDGDKKPLCTCLPGYTGVTCDSDIDECALGLCGSNSLKCDNTEGSYNCSCTPGWQGQNCSLDINECNSVTTIPCSGNGFCTNLPGTFHCKCLPGFKGILCEQFVNTCNNIKCFNNASCEIKDEGPVCRCAAGRTGPKCETDVDECESFPCKNSGTCQNTEGSFVCTCYSGWTGNVCQTDLNECLDKSTCSHNGLCSNVAGTYQCACLKGWQGMSCEISLPTNLQGNVLAFTFQENITSTYIQPVVSYMYLFLTTYVCSGQDVQLQVNSAILNVISLTITCNGVPVSKDTITTGLSRVPNDTLTRLFPLTYKQVQQILTLETTTTTTSKNSKSGLGSPAIVGIAASSIILILVASLLTVVYLKRRNTDQDEDKNAIVTPLEVLGETTDE